MALVPSPKGAGVSYLYVPPPGDEPELRGLEAWLPDPNEPVPQWYLDMAPAIHEMSGAVLELLKAHGYDGESK